MPTDSGCDRLAQKLPLVSDTSWPRAEKGIDLCEALSKLRNQLLLPERQTADAVGWVKNSSASRGERGAVRIVFGIGAQKSSKLVDQRIVLHLHIPVQACFGIASLRQSCRWRAAASGRRLPLLKRVPRKLAGTVLARVVQARAASRQESAGVRIRPTGRRCPQARPSRLMCRTMPPSDLASVVCSLKAATANDRQGSRIERAPHRSRARGRHRFPDQRQASGCRGSFHFASGRPKSGHH